MQRQDQPQKGGSLQKEWTEGREAQTGMKKDLMIAHNGARLLGGLKIFGRLLALVVALLSVSRPCAASVQVPVLDEVPFKLVDGYLIVVKGSLPGLARTVNVLIDTGATATFVDRRLAIAAGLRDLPPMGVTSTAFGSPLDVERVVIDGLLLGGRIITRSCLAADLPRDDIDIILGLDVLRGTSLRFSYRL